MFAGDKVDAGLCFVDQLIPVTGGVLLLFRLSWLLDGLWTAFSETFSFFFCFYFGGFVLQFDFLKRELNNPELLSVRFAVSALDMFAFEVALEFVKKVIVLGDLIESD